MMGTVRRAGRSPVKAIVWDVISGVALVSARGRFEIDGYPACGA
jgi:hypothetical protein